MDILNKAFRVLNLSRSLLINTTVVSSPGFAASHAGSCALVRLKVVNSIIKMTQSSSKQDELLWLYLEK